jgi:hypothetical protein
MSGYEFRPPLDEDMGLFIGIAGGPGTGKTWSGMELCTGIVGPDNRFAVIDTENKRASHYKKYFKFDVFNFEAPFTSERYGEAVQAAYDAGYKAIMIDSFSHEHDGIGGYLDSQAKDLEERVARSLKKYPNGNEYDVSKQLTPSSWIEPKRARKRMRQILLACSSTIPLVFCLRAEEKIFHTVDGKLVARKIPEWQPICDKGMPFEMTALFMLHNDAPGIPHVYLKPMQEQHKPLFPLDKQLGRESGRLIAEWSRGAAGGAKKAEGEKEEKKESFLEIMNREYQRLGKERFYEILKANDKQAVEEITDRKEQIKIYSTMVAAK